MIGSNLFLDSSIWLGYFLGDIPETKNLVENKQNQLLTSMLSIHEVFKRLRKSRGDLIATRAIEFIEQNSFVLGLNRDITLDSVYNCEKYKLHAIDSLIYTTAMGINSLFVTADSDFKKTPKTKLIKILT